MTEDEKLLLQMFGQRMRLARERLGLTQSDLAARLGTAQEVISRYENGKRAVPLTQVANYAEALGVSVSYLFGQSCEPDELSVLGNAMFPTFKRLLVQMLRGDLRTQYMVISKLNDCDIRVERERLRFKRRFQEKKPILAINTLPEVFVSLFIGLFSSLNATPARQGDLMQQFVVELHDADNLNATLFQVNANESTNLVGLSGSLLDAVSEARRKSEDATS